MSSTPATEVFPAQRRIRHQARDAAVLMLFSACVSVGVAGVFLLLTGLLPGPGR